MQNLSSLSPREKTTNTVIYGFCVAMLGLGLSVILTSGNKRALCQDELMTGILISSVGMLSLSGMSVRRQTSRHAKIETIAHCILCAGMTILAGLAMTGVQSAEVILRSVAVVASLSCVGKAAEVVGRRIASDIQSMREGCWRLNEKVLEVAEGVSNNITEVKEVVVNNITGISGVVASNIVDVSGAAIAAVNNVTELTEAAVNSCKNLDEQVVLISTQAVDTCKNFDEQLILMNENISEAYEDLKPKIDITLQLAANAMGSLEKRTKHLFS